MFVVLREEAEGYGGHRVVAPAAVECCEQTPTLLGGGNQVDDRSNMYTHINYSNIMLLTFKCEFHIGN